MAKTSASGGDEQARESEVAKQSINTRQRKWGQVATSKQGDPQSQNTPPRLSDERGNERRRGVNGSRSGKTGRQLSATGAATSGDEQAVEVQVANQPTSNRRRARRRMATGSDELATRFECANEGTDNQQRARLVFFRLNLSMHPRWTHHQVGTETISGIETVPRQ